MADYDNDNELIAENINYNSEDNNVIINFNANCNTKVINYLTEQPVLNDRLIQIDNLKKRVKDSKAIKTKDKSNSKVNYSNPNKSIKGEQVNNNNQKESKSVQFRYSPLNNNNGIKENSIVKTEQGYEIYFVENSVSNSKKNKTASNKDDQTVQEDINTQELISQNYGLKEAMKNHEDTYNSLEKEFMFQTNVNNSNNINGDNNNCLLLNLSDNDNSNSDNNNGFFTNISQNNILNENSIHFNSGKEGSNANNHIIINFNNYNYQFSGMNLDADNSNIKRYNSNNLSLEDLSLYSRQNSKLVKKKIFQNNPVCNVSNRLVNDENNVLNKSHLANRSNSNYCNYKFIDNVKENAYINRMNIIKTMIPMSRFLLLKKDIMLIIIHFSYDDIDEIKSSFECIQTKINATLSNYFYGVIDQFNNAYCNDLELYEYYFKTNKKRPAEALNLVSSNIFNRKFYPKTKYVSLDLYIKAKIISKKINRTYSINLLFNDVRSKSSVKTSRDQMILTWRYVVVNRKDINVWIASESEDYDGRISRFCYIQPILSYAPDDFISIKLPLLFKDNSLDPTNIKWLPMDKLTYSPEKSNCIFYEKSVYYNTHASLIKQFDTVRFCELETLIHLWKNEKSLMNRKIVNEVRKLLMIGDVFAELSFEFDVRRVYIFKVRLKAVKKGMVKRNKYINFDLVVKEDDGFIVNELQCLGLLNSINSQFEMRMGQILVFYFTEIGG